MKLIYIYVIFITILSLPFSFEGYCQKRKIADNFICFSCHDDPDITMEKNGRTISLEVKKFIFSQNQYIQA